MFKAHDWSDEALMNANDATAAAGGKNICIYSGNEINALICEVQAWRRSYPTDEFCSGPNVLTVKRDLSRRASVSGKKRK